MDSNLSFEASRQGPSAPDRRSLAKRAEGPIAGFPRPIVPEGSVSGSSASSAARSLKSVLTTHAQRWHPTAAGSGQRVSASGWRIVRGDAQERIHQQGQPERADEEQVDRGPGRPIPQSRAAQDPARLSAATVGRQRRSMRPVRAAATSATAAATATTTATISATPATAVQRAGRPPAGLSLPIGAMPATSPASAPRGVQGDGCRDAQPPPGRLRILSRIANPRAPLISIEETTTAAWGSIGDQPDLAGRSCPTPGG